MIILGPFNYVGRFTNNLGPFIPVMLGQFPNNFIGPFPNNFRFVSQ